MGITAENIAEKYAISREEQDAFAATSQNRAEAAQAAGKFTAEITPVSIPQRKGDPIVISEDEEFKNIKFDKVPALAPVFDKEGTVTAANASTLNDGAVALVLISDTTIPMPSPFCFCLGNFGLSVMVFLLKLIHLLGNIAYMKCTPKNLL
jgi:acetyl-CoA C-acetyltransferase